MSSPFISKSKYLSGLQCPKLLWHYYNAKELIPDVGDSTQAIFDQGHVVGELAKKLYPDGIEVACNATDFAAILERSRLLLQERKPLFEAGFQYINTFARVDILNPVEGGKWDIIEVKSTTGVKDVNLHDLALQRYCYEGAGVPIRRCCLMHINNQYVRHGAIEPGQLFGLQDITDQVAEAMRGLPQRLDDMLNVIQSPACPDIKIGPHCNDPYACPLQPVCWAFLPEDHVMTLYRMRQEKAFAFINQGILSFQDIHDGIALSSKQEIQIRTSLTSAPHVDRARIAEFLGTLQYPVYFMDFETFGSAIPFFDGVRPYQQVPFQFSVHVLASPDAKPQHHSFLAEGQSDPRPAFMRRLSEVMGDHGTVLVFNKGFELTRLRELAELLPEYTDWVRQITGRTVDLLGPFRDFHYYHPSQKGSASIKKVLPALTGQSYDGMDISEGGTASREFIRVTYKDVGDDDRQRIRHALEEYCKLDTHAMIDITQALAKITTETPDAIV